MSEETKSKGEELPSSEPDILQFLREKTIPRAIEILKKTKSPGKRKRILRKHTNNFINLLRIPQSELEGYGDDIIKSAASSVILSLSFVLAYWLLRGKGVEVLEGRDGVIRPKTFGLHDSGRTIPLRVAFGAPVRLRRK